MVPLRHVIERARERLAAVSPPTRGAHWRCATEILAIAEEAIPLSHALAERHIHIAERYVAKAETGLDPALD